MTDSASSQPAATLLPAEEPPPLAVGAVTDVGPTRQRNEDAVLIPGVVLAGAPHGRWAGAVDGTAACLLEVFDGMGAHGGGSLAAAVAAVSMNELLASTPPPVVPDEEWLGRALQHIGDMVVDVGQFNPQTRIMGAATAGVYVGRTAVLAFNVGDCRAYAWEDGYLSLLTTDHRSRRDGGLTRSLGGTGQRENVVPGIVELDRSAARRFLLCSDGLSDTLDFAVIQSLIGGQSVARSALALVEAAVAAGSSDNVSVIVADIPAA